MSSTKRGKISARRRAAAVDALASIAADETKPAHSRVRAAAALVAAAGREDDAHEDPRGKAGRNPLLVLPLNDRDGEKPCIYRLPSGAPYMVHYNVADMAQHDALVAEAEAELDQMFPADADE